MLLNNPAFKQASETNGNRANLKQLLSSTMATGLGGNSSISDAVARSAQRTLVILNICAYTDNTVCV
jgi:hypothetical protein